MRCVTVAALAFACLVAWPAGAQQVLVGTSKNRAVEPIIGEISPARIEATVRKLASFGTRHTLSDPDNLNRGIGAARRWIKTELESYATIVKGLSKDDLFFAVQAVDRDGNASLPTFPVPPSIRPTSTNRQ